MLILTAYFASIALWLLYRRVSAFRFDLFTTLVWLASLLLGSVGLITYDALRTNTVLLVIACHTLLLLGFHMVGPRSKRLYYEFRGELGIRADIFALLAVIFVVLALARSGISRDIPILSAAGSLEEMRQAHWARGGESVSLFSQVVRVFSYAATAYVLLIPLFLRSSAKGMKTHLVLAGLAFIMLIDQSFRDGGRAVVVYAMIGMAAIYFALYRPSKKQVLAGWMAGIAIIYALTVPFYLARNSNFGRAPAVYVEYNCHGGRMVDEVARGSLELKAFALGTCYVVEPVHVLDDFLSDNEGFWDYRYGVYNLSTIFPEEFTNIRDEIAIYFKRKGYGQNPWATSMRDFWIDFGWFAFLAYLPLGLFFGWLARHRVFRTETDVMRFGLLAVCAFLVPFLSPLVIRQALYPLVVTLLVDFGLYLVMPQKRQVTSQVNDRRDPQRTPSDGARGVR